MRRVCLPEESGISITWFSNSDHIQIEIWRHLFFNQAISYMPFKNFAENFWVAENELPILYNEAIIA